jgi:hypothetical protein
MSRVVQIAKIEIGYVEQPVNKTKYGEWFGMNGTAWCGIFVSWCCAMAGKPLGNIGYSKGFAGCQTAFKFFKDNGWIVEIPQEGDIVLFAFKKEGVYNHAGIFVEPSTRAGYFVSIEGNTSLKSDHNGGSVMHRERSYKNCIFARPKLKNIPQ